MRQNWIVEARLSHVYVVFGVACEIDDLVDLRFWASLGSALTGLSAMNLRMRDVTWNVASTEIVGTSQSSFADCICVKTSVSCKSPFRDGIGDGGRIK